MSTKDKIIAVAAGAAYVLVAPYLLLAFCAWSFDVSEWSALGRAAYASWIGLTVIAIAKHVFDMREEDQRQAYREKILREQELRK